MQEFKPITAWIKKVIQIQQQIKKKRQNKTKSKSKSNIPININKPVCFLVLLGPDLGMELIMDWNRINNRELLQHHL